MSGPQYVEPWYAEMQKAAEALSPAAIAAKADADQVFQSQPKPQPSGWFNTDSSPFGRGPNKGGSRRRSRKSRKSRRK
jgi:hypothetical protein